MDNPHLRLSLLGKGILLRAGPVAGGWVKCGACTMMAVPVILELRGTGMKENQEFRVLLGSQVHTQLVLCENLSQKTTN